MFKWNFRNACSLWNVSLWKSRINFCNKLILMNLKEDVYEDLELNEQHFQQIKDIEHELEMAKELKDLDYQDELSFLCRLLFSISWNV